jgi:hypothetical protein
MPNKKTIQKKKTKQSRTVSKSIIDSIITDIEQAAIFKLVFSSFRSWYKNWPWLLFSMLCDILFLVSASATVTLIQLNLLFHLEEMMRLTGEATGGLMNIYNETAKVSSGLLSISNNMTFQDHLSTIIKYIALMFLLVFIFWILFEGLSWYASYRISTSELKYENRVSFLIFMKNFILQSLPFYLFIIALILLSIRLLFAIRISIAPFMSVETLAFLFWLFVIMTVYFGSLCFTITTKSSYQNLRQCFLYGIRKFTKTIQSFAFILVLFFIINLILKISFIRNDPFVLMIIGIIIFLPALVFSRVLLFGTAECYWKK